MPRRGRIHQQAVCYHLCNRCINRDELFHDERDDARYIERNPVRARLMELAWDWPFSSAGFCALGRGDELTDTDVRYDEAGLSAGEREAYAAMLRDDEHDQWMRSQTALAVGRPAFAQRFTQSAGRLRPRRGPSRRRARNTTEVLQ